MGRTAKAAGHDRSLAEDENDLADAGKSQLAAERDRLGGNSTMGGSRRTANRSVGVNSYGKAFFAALGSEGRYLQEKRPPLPFRLTTQLRS